jgi:uncharacterized membrane protein YhaH (DUF805 family)
MPSAATVQPRGIAMEWMLMPLRRYADFSGRSRRTEYWMWVLFQFLIGLAFTVLIMMLGGAALMTGDIAGLMAVGGVVVILYVLYLLVALAFFIPNLAVTVRRLHDTDRSGWWMMLFWGPYLLVIASSMLVGADAASGGDGAAGGALALVSMLALVVGSIVLLVFMFLEGTRGPNQYGADPKGQDTGQVFA